MNFNILKIELIVFFINN